MDTTEIILSTRNPSKTEQIKTIFNGLPVRILTPEEAGVTGDAVEDGKTLEENALKKAHFVWGHTKRWCLADDTGLFIDALGGRPGIHSARWAGADATTEQIMRFTLEKLKDVAPPNRTATFQTVAVLIAPDGTPSTFTGAVKGVLLTKPRVPFQPKMPYSSLFVPDGQPKVWAEMKVDEENEVSHRGKAFRQVKEFIKRELH